MKNFITSGKASSLVLMLALVFSVSSCKDEPIVGCTDPEAENYDSLANEDSGNCEFASTKFLGAYEGMIMCPGALAFLGNSGVFPFEITEGSSGMTNTVDVVLNNLNVTLSGTVVGNALSIAEVVPSYPFDANMDGLPDLTVDLDVVGSASMNADASALTGTLAISIINVDNGVEVLNDNCTLTGDKL